MNKKGLLKFYINQCGFSMPATGDSKIEKPETSCRRYCDTSVAKKDRYSTQMSISDALRSRRSVRNPSSKTVSFTDFSNFLNVILGIRPSGSYPTPMASGIREIRYTVLPNSVSEIDNGIAFEYDSEAMKLTPIAERKYDVSIESWERYSGFNVVLSIPLKDNSRNYPNNLALCFMEAGAIIQAANMVSQDMGLDFCPSGIINVENFWKMCPNLLPLTMLSASR